MAEIKVPDGWRLVPVEATEEITDAIRNAIKTTPRCGTSGMSIDAQWRSDYAKEISAYSAMLAASPPPPKEQQDG